ncbi:N-lysine methyltransferase KMT5A-A [Hypomesus transpacificus]|uniref:N-lysine methyltransferase KMT5A-A n=1 Tax=Hypomesus transpacificus TaxID=137520 RepID=UPI001F07B1A0|nr:N-lysine methyltransferase KMT5A-A [Hypomesus transpacificus]
MTILRETGEIDHLVGHHCFTAEWTQILKRKKKSEMNGDIVCGHSITLLSPSKSKSPVHDEMTIKLTQEGKCPGRCSLQNDTSKPGDARRLNPANSDTCVLTLTEREGCHSQHPPCWTGDLASSQHHYPPACLRSPDDLSPPPSNNVIHNPFLANNSAHLNKYRRGIRPRVKGKKPAFRNAENSQNRKVTDYYPIRRSSRKCKAELKCEQKKHIDDLITNGIEEGMEVQHIEGKGRGVFATQSFQKGQFVVEYHGDLLEITDAKQREMEYAQNPATGCYMYYFQYLCKTYCIDATKETGRMGRLINHSKLGNCQTKLHDINGIPHLILVASRDIDEGEELQYDYGDRSKASIAAHPWLKH